MIPVGALLTESIVHFPTSWPVIVYLKTSSLVNLLLTTQRFVPSVVSPPMLPFFRFRLNALSAFRVPLVQPAAPSYIQIRSLPRSTIQILSPSVAMPSTLRGH